VFQNFATIKPTFTVQGVSTFLLHSAVFSPMLLFLYISKQLESNYQNGAYENFFGTVGPEQAIVDGAGGRPSVCLQEGRRLTTTLLFSASTISILSLPTGCILNHLRPINLRRVARVSVAFSGRALS
jgi:hypothetical protein